MKVLTEDEITARRNLTRLIDENIIDYTKERDSEPILELVKQKILLVEVNGLMLTADFNLKLQDWFEDRKGYLNKQFSEQKKSLKLPCSTNPFRMFYNTVEEFTRMAITEGVMSVLKKYRIGSRAKEIATEIGFTTWMMINKRNLQEELVGGRDH